MSERAGGRGEPLCPIPSGQRIDLALAPRKTSWDAGTSTAQIELGRYLDHVAAVVAPRLHELTGALALRLDVGLPVGVDPLFEHDLDNFLHPVIKQLGGRRFVSAWAPKAPGDRSQLLIEPAEPAPPETAWQRWPGRTTASTAREHEWKTQVKAAPAGATELPPGPVGVQISLTVSPERSWPNLWKMVIDTLDPILGRSFPDDEYDPRDGRIVRLGIHVSEDASVGWEVPFVVRARPADLSWPAWLEEVGPWYADELRDLAVTDQDPEIWGRFLSLVVDLVRDLPASEELAGIIGHSVPVLLDASALDEAERTELNRSANRTAFHDDLDRWSAKGLLDDCCIGEEARGDTCGSPNRERLSVGPSSDYASRWASPDARSIGRSIAARTVAWSPTRMSWRLARVTPV
jgi:hypothetical protein